MGIWYTVFDASHLSGKIVDVALVTQSLQGAVNAIVYGMYENVWWRRRKQQPQEQNDVEEEKVEKRREREREREREDDNDDDKNLNSPLLGRLSVSFSDPNLKDKDSRKWINRQRMKIALRRAYNSEQENQDDSPRSPSMRIV